MMDLYFRVVMLSPNIVMFKVGLGYLRIQIAKSDVSHAAIW